MRGLIRKGRALRVLLLLLLICLPFTLFTACTENEEADARLLSATEALLTAVRAEDAEAAYALFDPSVSYEQFSVAYAEMKEMLKGVTSYEIEKLGDNTDGDEYAVSFRITANGEEGELAFAATARERAGMTGLSAFYLQKNKATVAPVGSLTNMAEADGLQWTLLILGGAVWVVTALAVIDCVRSARQERRGMMLIVILIGMLSVSVSYGASPAFLLEHGYYFPYTALLRDGTGTDTLRLFLPVGAVAWFILRRRFVDKK